MKKLYILLGLVLVLSGIAASVYVVYYMPNGFSEPTPSATPTPTASPSVEPTTSPTSTVSPSESAIPTSTPETTLTPTPTPTSVTVVDSRGVNVTLAYPVQRIISTEAGITEIICALGGEDKIVGILSATVNWPTAVNNRTTVGASSNDINVEVTFDLNPDLIVASSSLLNYNQTIAAIEAAGIPLYIDNSNLPSRVSEIVNNFGLILGNQEKAEQINNNIDYYNDLIEQRIANITHSERTTFFAPMTSQATSYTYGNSSKFGAFLVGCGGVNIAENLSLSYPQLSYEFILTADPEVIILMASSITTNETVYQTDYNTLMSDTTLSTVSAVQNNRVHLYNYWLTGGIEYPVGKLYFAKMLYPDLFADIDPAAIYQQLIQEYFGETPTGVYFYP